MTPEEQIDQRLNERIQEARERDALDKADPTALFQEAQEERERIRSQSTQTGAPNFLTNNPTLTEPGIHSIVAGNGISVNASNGVVTVSAEVSPQDLSAVAGDSTGEPEETAILELLVVFNSADVEPIEFHVNPYTVPPP